MDDFILWLFILLNLPAFRGREMYYAARRSRGFSTDEDNVAALQTPTGAAPPPSCFSQAMFLSRYGHRCCLSGMQVAPNQSNHTERIYKESCWRRNYTSRWAFLKGQLIHVLDSILLPSDTIVKRLQPRSDPDEQMRMWCHLWQMFMRASACV